MPLTAVADVSFGQGPSSIERYNRIRRVNIGTDLTGGMEIGPALEKVFALPAARSLPPTVSFQRGGDAEIMQEVFQGFAIAMGTGILMVLGVLVLLFHSVFQPLTILMSLPLSLGGVILALLLTGKAISMPVVIGILMLMGIVTKNAIMLVDFAVEKVREGMNRRDAILDAGRKRARPIIMTTIAMGAGMIPPALGAGDGGEFRAPMAIAVIGGLIVSTVLSLVFVPSFYTVMDDAGRFFGWVFGRFVGPPTSRIRPGTGPWRGRGRLAWRARRCCCRPMPPRPAMAHAHPRRRRIAFRYAPALGWPRGSPVSKGPPPWMPGSSRSASGEEPLRRRHLLDDEAIGLVDAGDPPRVDMGDEVIGAADARPGSTRTSPPASRAA